LDYPAAAGGSQVHLANGRAERRTSLPKPQAPLSRIDLYQERAAAAEPVSPFDLRPEDQPTDLGNCKRLVRQHGQDLRYCPEWQTWFVWDGTRWQRDTGNGKVMERAKGTAQQIMDEAVSRTNRLQDEAKTLAPADRARRQQAAFKQGQELTNFAKQSQSLRRLEAMVTLAESEPGIVVHPEQLDADPWLLNV